LINKERTAYPQCTVKPVDAACVGYTHMLSGVSALLTT